MRPLLEAMILASSVSCCLGPPAPPKESTKTAGQSLRRACVAAAACAVMGMADGAGADMAVLARADDVAAAAVGAASPAKARPRWSERRQCPAWRANSLENIVPENLPRAPARRRFSSVVSISPAALAPAPDLVVPPPFPAARPGTGCFSL